MGSYKEDDDFTVRFRFEFRFCVKIRPQKKMVVYFAVDCKDSLSIWTNKWLCTGVLQLVEKGSYQKKKED
jgi:hypothetical protein